MSIQLVLIPQALDGTYSSVSTPVFNQYVVDNTNFNTIPSFGGVYSIEQYVTADAINIAPPVSSWYRFRPSSNPFWDDCAMPSRSNVNKLELHSAVGASSSISGVYQLINGLTVGASYELKVKITQAGAGGILYVGLVGGTLTGSITTLQANTLNTAWGTGTTGYQSVTFVADHTEEILALSYVNSNNRTIQINHISIKESSITPTLVYTDLHNGQVICDLYEEEDIPLSLSVDNFKNVAEKTQSYTKDFKLPATKRNNKIFSHLFEVTKRWDMYSFNPYKKTQCILKQDGYNIFKGYLRLIDIIDQDKEISYSVNLFSTSITLIDELKSKNISDLTALNELDHLYNKSNIKSSWDSTGILLSTPLSTNSFAGAYNDTHTQVLKYPFVDWTGNIVIADGLNPSANTGSPELKTLEDAFRPFINCKYLVDNIFATSGFTYTSVFLNTDKFTKLFMDFNWGTGSAPSDFEGTTDGRYVSSLATVDNTATSVYSALEINNFNPIPSTEMGWTNYKFTAQSNGATYNMDYTYGFNVTSGATGEFRWVHKNSSGVVYPLGEIDYTSVTFTTTTINSATRYFYIGNFTRTLILGDTLEAQFRATGGTVKQDRIYGPYSALLVASVSLVSTTSNTLLNTERGGLGQWEFLKGIFNMFNLIILEDKTKEGRLIIEPYDDIFNIRTSGTTLLERSIQLDWTDKIDTTQIKLKPLDLLSKTTFKYEEDDDDYTFNEYKRATNGQLYGEKIWDAKNQFDFTLLEGEEEILGSPFASTIVKPLYGVFASFIVPSVFSSNDDNTENEGYDNLPRILYNNGKKYTGTTYFIPEANGYSAENQDDFLQFSHLSRIPTVISNPPLSTDTDDYNFGECQLINPVGSAPANNLFNSYWSQYYFELYNINTRIMTLKVNLNASDVHDFDFANKVMIKNRKYRVNKIEYKPNDLSTVEFILIP